MQQHQPGQVSPAQISTGPFPPGQYPMMIPIQPQPGQGINPQQPQMIPNPQHMQPFHMMGYAPYPFMHAPPPGQGQMMQAQMGQTPMGQSHPQQGIIYAPSPYHQQPSPVGHPAISYPPTQPSPRQRTAIACRYCRRRKVNVISFLDV